MNIQLIYQIHKSTTFFKNVLQWIKEYSLSVVSTLVKTTLIDSSILLINTTQLTCTLSQYLLVLTNPIHCYDIRHHKQKTEHY